MLIGSEMTIPHAIVIGALIIAASIIVTRIIAPYQIASGTAIVWRVNTITGSVELCNIQTEVGNPITGNPRCR
jgi:hypothetical protein